MSVPSTHHVGAVQEPGVHHVVQYRGQRSRSTPRAVLYSGLPLYTTCVLYSGLPHCTPSGVYWYRDTLYTTWCILGTGTLHTVHHVVYTVYRDITRRTPCGVYCIGHNTPYTTWCILGTDITRRTPRGVYWVQSYTPYTTWVLYGYSPTHRTPGGVYWVILATPYTTWCI